MKKLFIALVAAALIPLTGRAGNNTAPGRTEASAVASPRNAGTYRILELIDDFRDAEGFNVLQIKGMGTSILKRVILGAIDKNDPEERALADVISGMKKFTVIEYGNCSDETKSRFSRKVGKLLNEDNLLMDVKDDGGTLKIYGMVSDDGERVDNFVIHAPEEGALICLFGTVITESLTRLMN